VRTLATRPNKRSPIPWNRIDKLDPSQRVLVRPSHALVLLNPPHSLVLGLGDTDDLVEALQLLEPRPHAPSALEERV
jgi:hypothetical protein